MKSECSEHQKKIAAFFLGDLAEGEKQELEAHLAACSRCSLELNSYARTIQQLTSAMEEPAPHHFFIHSEERSFNPWQLFRRMKPAWQATVTCAVALILLLGIAAISRLQIRSNPDGWMISFGSNEIDWAALKKDFLAAVEKKNQEARIAWIREVHSEIARSHKSLTQQQQLLLAAALSRMDSHIMGRIAGSEGNTREETRRLISDLYRSILQQRAQDLEAINLRFESADANDAIKTRETNEILSALLQITDMRLDRIGGQQ